MPKKKVYDQYTRNVGNTSMLLEREEVPPTLHHFHSSGLIFEAHRLLYHSA
jgi:hypothetical protein